MSLYWIDEIVGPQSAGGMTGSPCLPWAWGTPTETTGHDAHTGFAWCAALSSGPHHC